MSKPGFTSVSLNDETVEMLWSIAKQIEAESGVQLPNLPQVIRHLARNGVKAEAK